MAMKLSVLPAFNGADEESLYETYSLCPDPDGHSVWAFMLYWAHGFPDNFPGAADVQYGIVKIDLNTKAITKTWQYPYDGPGDMPLGVVEGSCIVFFDAAGKIWTPPGDGTIRQNDPDNAFVELKSIGSGSFDPAIAQWLSLTSDTTHASWVNWTFGGHDYLAYHIQGAVSLESLIVVVDLTVGTVIGNWWSHDGIGNNDSNPAFSGVTLQLGDVFIDSSGTLWWVMEELNSGGVSGASANAWFFKWTPSSGVTAQPTNGQSLADPFLNGVTWTIVPSSRYNSSGKWFSNGNDLRAQYLPASNSVLIGKAQFTSPAQTGLGGDLAILKLSDFSQVAFVPSTDPADMLYAPDNGEDIGSYVFQDNSKRLGISNTNIAVPSSGASNSDNYCGKLSLISRDNLSVIKSYDLSAAVLAADPLAVAGFRWVYQWPTNNLINHYEIGNMLTTDDLNLYISKIAQSYPAATNPRLDSTNWTQLTPGTPFPGGSGLVYRGIFDAAVTYHKNDVVVRTDYFGSNGGRPFTATADSVGVDPIISGSNFWFPASNSPLDLNSPEWTNTRINMCGPLAHVLYYEAEERIVWTYDFLGSPLYMLSPDVLPPPPNVPGPPGGTKFIPKPQPQSGPIQNIPLNNLPNQVWEVAVNVNGTPVTLQIVLRYNEIARYWSATVKDSDGNLLIDSLPFITGTGISQNLLGQFAYLAIGSAAIFNASGKPVDHPNNQDLGKDFLLLWGGTSVN